MGVIKLKHTHTNEKYTLDNAHVGHKIYLLSIKCIMNFNDLIIEVKAAGFKSKDFVVLVYKIGPN